MSRPRKIFLWFWVWGCIAVFLPRVLFLKFRHHLHITFLVEVYRGGVNFESLAQQEYCIAEGKSRIAAIERSQREIANSIEKAWRVFGVGD